MTAPPLPPPPPPPSDSQAKGSLVQESFLHLPLVAVVAGVSLHA
jgi:hypothetical protein